MNFQIESFNYLIIIKDKDMKIIDDKKLTLNENDKLTLRIIMFSSKTFMITFLMIFEEIIGFINFTSFNLFLDTLIVTLLKIKSITKFEGKVFM